jgi:hypothetical protein
MMMNRCRQLSTHTTQETVLPLSSFSTRHDGAPNAKIDGASSSSLDSIIINIIIIRRSHDEKRGEKRGETLSSECREGDDDAPLEEGISRTGN